MNSNATQDVTKVPRPKKLVAARSLTGGGNLDDADLLKKPVNTLAIVPRDKKITVLFRKTYNVMLLIAQEQGLEKEIFRAPLTAVLSGLDFDSNDTNIIKRHMRAMATTAVEWQSPTKGEGTSWTVSGLIGHAEIKLERGQNWLEWSYSVKLKQELLEPSVFARLALGIISQLKSHGGVALYEICSRYRDVGRTSRQHWHWWRPVLSGKPDTPQQQKLEYRYFKRDVLAHALAEINAVTDLEVEMLEFREGRYTSDLQFVIKKKAQAVLPMQNKPDPVNMALVARAKKLGVDDVQGEALLYEYGEAALKSGIDALEKRIATAFPVPLRDPARYLKSMMPDESAKANKVAKMEAEEVEARKDPASPQSREAQTKRQSKWVDEWLRRRREKIIDDIKAMSEEEQQRMSAELLESMEQRKIHPSILKRLKTAGWQHPMVLQEMVRYFAVGTIGDNWDKPTPEQLLAIAAQLGDE